jgi:hypothetical protein
MTTNEIIPVANPVGLSDFSRFIKQNQYRNVDGRIFFGTFVPPNFPIVPTDRFHTVIEGQERRLDLIANSYYRAPELWWVLAVANDILSPFDDLEPGSILRVPSINTVTAYLSGSG